MNCKANKKRTHRRNKILRKSQSEFETMRNEPKQSEMPSSLAATNQKWTTEITTQGHNSLKQMVLLS